VGCASLLSRWNFPASFMIVNALGIRLGESGCQCRVVHLLFCDERRNGDALSDFQ
jgi:hypothetical protein